MTLRHVLLAALSKQADTGYGLSRRLREDLSHIWHARQQQVYRELGRLQDEGLVRVECLTRGNLPEKKRYSLTQAGAEQLDAWLTSSIPPPEAKSEAFVKLYCIERLPRQALERVLTRRLEQWERLCSDLRAKLGGNGSARAEDFGHRLSLAAALADAEAKAASGAQLLALLQSAADAEAGPVSRNGATLETAGLARPPH